MGTAELKNEDEFAGPLSNDLWAITGGATTGEGHLTLSGGDVLGKRNVRGQPVRIRGIHERGSRLWLAGLAPAIFLRRDMEDSSAIFLHVAKVGQSRRTQVARQGSRNSRWDLEFIPSANASLEARVFQDGELVHSEIIEADYLPDTLNVHLVTYPNPVHVLEMDGVDVGWAPGRGPEGIGSSVLCEDNNPCTWDSITNEGRCQHSPKPANTECSDGDLCNGTEMCSGTGACVAGTAPSCNDGNACTVDSCAPLVGCVSHPPSATACDDGNTCTVDSCVAGVGCKHDTQVSASCLITPTVSCVLEKSTGELTAVFGYTNSSQENVSAGAGEPNALTPQTVLTPPSWFKPGSNVAAFQADFSDQISWQVGNKKVTADRSSPRCATEDRPFSSMLVVNGIPHPMGLDADKVLADAILPADTDGNSFTPGDIKARASVTDDGALAASVPLWIPPGRNGLTPKLELDYNSRSGDGMLGVGWKLSAYSEIHRCNSTMSVEGKKAAFSFAKSDPLCLDGRKLVLVKGEVATVGAEYRLADDDFSKVIIKAVDELGPVVFEVRSKDGRISSFGSSPDSLMEGTPETMDIDLNSGDVYSLITSPPLVQRIGWALQNIRDRSGNEIRYEYEKNAKPKGLIEFRLANIKYTYHRLIPSPSRVVRFHYNDRAESQVRNTGGFSFFFGTTLKSIDVESSSEPGDAKLQLIRKYKLSYETDPLTHLKQLSEMTTCDGVGVCVRPTTFDYGTTAHGWEKAQIADVLDLRLPGPYYARQVWGLTPADMNGDGRDDIIYRKLLANGTGEALVRLNQADGFGFPSATGITQYPGFAPLPLPVDLSLTGKPWLIAAGKTFDNPLPEFFTQSGGAFTKWDFAVEPQPIQNWFLVGDVTGEGIPDVLRLLSRPGNSKAADLGVLVNPSANFFSQQIYRRVVVGGYDVDGVHIYEGQDGDFTAGQLVDIEGSGVPKLVFPFKKGHLALDLRGVVNGSQGQDPLPPLVVQGEEVTLPTESDLVWRFADFSGDGLVDALGVKTVGSSGSYGEPIRGYLAINKGGQFLPAEERSELRQVFGRTGIPVALDNGVRIIDYNGDGKQDLLLMDAGIRQNGDHTKSPAPTRSTMVVLESNGHGFTKIETDVPVGDRAGGTTFSDESYALSKVFDYDGDGQQDIVQVRGGKLEVYVRKNSPTLLRNIKTGLGDFTNVVYSPMADRSVYQPGINQGVPAYSPAKGRWLVSRIGYNNGMGGERAFRHSYEGMWFDVGGEGPLGVSKHSIEDLQLNTVRTRLFTPKSQTASRYPLRGKPTKETTVYKISDGSEIVEEMTTRYRVISDGSPKVMAALPERQLYTRTEKSPTGTQTLLSCSLQQNTFDKFGSVANRQKVVTDQRLTLDSDVASAAGAKTTEEMVLWNDESEWSLANPLLRTVTSRSLDGKQKTQTTSFTFDVAKHQVLTQTVEPNDSSSLLYLLTTFTHDDFGNITNIAQTDRSGRRRETSIIYDSKNIAFAEFMTNAEGHRQRTITDPRRGVVLATEDQNGIPTVFLVDTFGRPKGIRSPVQVPSFQTYIAETAGGYSVQTDGEDGSTSIVFFDSLGRINDKLIKGPDERWRTEKFRYDALSGKPYSHRGPSTDDEPGSIEVVGYDEAGRLSGLLERSGSVSNFSYSGRTVTVERTGGEKRVDTLDPLGRLAVRSQFNGPTPIDTTFSYGPFGKLDRITDSRNLVTSFEYDQLLRQTASVQPNVGRIETTFDAFGDPVKS